MSESEKEVPGKTNNDKKKADSWGQRNWFLVVIILLLTGLSGVNTYLTGGSFVSWLVVSVITSGVIIFVFEVRDVIRDQFASFLKGSEGKEARDFRGTMWFFGIIIFLSLILVAVYAPCCDRLDRESSGASLTAPNAQTNSPSESNTNDFSQNGLIRTDLTHTNQPHNISACNKHKPSEYSGNFRKHSITSLLWALAFLAGGTLAGFLFGIPKVVQSDGNPISANNPEGKPSANNASSSAYALRVNTNLTEISDWITKIIVGLGLINLKQMPGYIRDAGKVLCASLSACGCGGDHLAFAIAIIVYFSAVGLLFGYLMTRLFLAPAFAHADQNAAAELKATGAELASIKSDVSMLKDLKSPPTSAELGDIKIQPAAIGSKITESTQTKPAIELLMAAAQKYLHARSPQYADRVAIKNGAANEVAQFILTGAVTRDWIVSQVVQQPNDGLIAGYAVAVNSRPESEDFHRLTRLAPIADWKHARYKMAVALGKIFSDGLAWSDDVPAAKKMLKTFLSGEVDDSLKRRVIETAALIAQRTGKDIDLVN